jgi:hypothetical protein
MNEHNKLECSSLASLSYLVLGGAYPRVEHCAAALGKALVLLANITLS